MTLTDHPTHALDQQAMMLALRRTQAAIRLLPESPYGIATYLHELGVCGHTGDGDSNALEMYLRGTAAEDLDLWVESVEVGNRRWSFTVRLPEAVVDFARGLDAGYYPELMGELSYGSCTLIGEDELPGYETRGV